MKSNKIKAAAIKHRDGRVFTLPEPNRHSDIFGLLPEGELQDGEQGFITQDGTFVNRTEAYKIAKYHKQLLPQDTLGYTPTPGTLYSEDLW